MTQLATADAAILKDVAEDALVYAKQLGATAAELSVSCDDGLAVSARMGEVETVEHTRDQGLGITVFFGKRKGHASTADIRPGSIQEIIDAACNIAKYTAEDDCAGLPPEERMAHGYPELDLDHPWNIQADEAVELAVACEQAARETDARIVNSEGASVHANRGTVVFANSHGFIGSYSGTRHSISCSVIGQEGGHMQRDYWYDYARHAKDLDAPESIGRKAAERTISRLNAEKLSTQQVPVLYQADVARGLLGHLVAAVRGSSLYRKASFLVDAQGEQLFPDWVRVHEQPHLKGALGSGPFDGEGVATQDRDLISGGVLQGYVLDHYSACRLGLETTGNAGGTRNLSMESSGQSFDELLKQMGTGVLVTELIGHGLNLVTGDYSRGAAGFWVENGEIQHPVEEFTVAGNLKTMFKNLVAVGNDIDTRSGTLTGSWLLDNLTIGGQ